MKNIARKVFGDSFAHASAEISVGESDEWSQKILTAFPAFRVRNYKLYFTGQLVSLIGTWLQIVAEGYLVFQLTHSAYLVGVVTAIGALPILLFSLFGGVIVDRYNTKSILFVTQSASMILALLYGGLTITHHISIPLIMILAFLLGIVNALDSPARQSFIIELVGKEYLSSAIALNSGMFNGARVIGPGIAGFLIAFIGVGGTFIVNGLSYIASIIALTAMVVAPHIPTTHENPLTAIRQGLSYSFRHPVIRILLFFSAVMSIFGWSYTTLMPVIAERVFQQNAAGLGYLYAFSGIGALTGAVVVSIYAKKVRVMRLILIGNITFMIALFLFTLTHQILTALPLLIFIGFGLLLQFSLVNTVIQFMVPNEIRGRVMSIYTLMFIGLTPFGSYQVGLLADRFGSMTAIRIGLIFVFIFSIYLYTNRRMIEKEHAKHIQH